MNRCFREPDLIGRAGVALDLFQRRVTRDGHDLVRAGAELGETCRGGLAEPVRRAMRKAGIVAPLAHLVPQPGDREGAPVVVHEESEVPGRAGVDDARELVMHRDFERDRLPLAVLVLGEPELVALPMLAAKARDVGSTLPESAGWVSIFAPSEEAA